jgi:hypothetical protein
MKVFEDNMDFNLDKMMKSVVSLHDQFGSFINENNSRPTPDSQATHEINSFERPESVVSTHSQGWLLCEATADQLMGLTKLLTEPVQAIAPWTSVRALIEASGLGVWLLNTDIDVKARVQRGFAFRFDGLTEQVKFVRKIGDEKELSKAISRIDSVEQTALELGYPKIEKDGKRTGIAQIMPSITEIVQQELDQEAVYRLSSAMIHAHSWAVSQLSFKILEEETMIVNDEDGNKFSIKTLEKYMDPTLVIYLLHNAMIGFARPMWCLCRLFGWNLDTLRSILNENFDAMSIAKNKRFWN